MADSIAIPGDYAPLLAEIKARVRRAQARAVLAVNAELIRLYWEIGGMICQRQQQEEKGFSERNIKRMLAFYREFPQANFVPQAVAQMEGDTKVPQAAAQFPAELLLALPWGHHAELMAKVKEPSTRQWYMQAAVEHGWSRTTLVMQIASAPHQRQGISTSNFAERLPAPASELVQQALKDPYIFDFLTLTDDFHERELETGLLTHVEKFLLELGQGFAFVGRQFRVELDGRDFYIDLLFYHLKLRCFIVIDLKRGDFKPEYDEAP